MANAMAIFKLFSIGVLSTAVITKVQANGTKDGCTFSLSASGGIECPAGQLDDGQIRLNGSYPTAEFTIRGDKIWDSAGHGCIVTPAPITQVQCDLNAEPAPGFSIDSSNKLLYQGSSEFYACPATDTEYNVYIKPDFGQTKCFAVTLTASGCGSSSQPPPPPPPPPPTTSAPTCPSTQPPSTVTETTTCTVTQAVTVSGNASTVSVTGPVSTVSVTGPVSTVSVSGVGPTITDTTTCTVTDTSTITSMDTVTSTLPCTSSSSSSTSKICQKCQSHNSTTTSSWTTSTTVCHKCVGTGTGTGTGGPHPTGWNSTWSWPSPTGMTISGSSSPSSILWN